mmetsp:Transcript_36695/g.74777  ORF Transcript_36695/g.74777 Transcript_36695/m.74777 type:complete len:157 (+) Transcript_36695:14-484(+)
MDDAKTNCKDELMCGLRRFHCLDRAWCLVGSRLKYIASIDLPGCCFLSKSACNYKRHEGDMTKCTSLHLHEAFKLESLRIFLVVRTRAHMLHHLSHQWQLLSSFKEFLDALLRNSAAIPLPVSSTIDAKTLPSAVARLWGVSKARTSPPPNTNIRS